MQRQLFRCVDTSLFSLARIAADPLVPEPDATFGALVVHRRPSFVLLMSGNRKLWQWRGLSHLLLMSHGIRRTPRFVQA